MEDEILDIRLYVELLLRHWKWIVAGGFLAALVAFAVSFLMPEKYEATAVVLATEDQQLLQFDPRIQSESGQQPLKAFPELAMTDDLVQQVMVSVAPLLEEPMTVQAFKRRLTAVAGADPSIIRLTAKAESPELAAQIADNWAKAFVDWGNSIYGSGNNSQLAFYEAQLTEAQTDLDNAESALVAFQGRDRRNIIDSNLSALQSLQEQYLAEQNDLQLLSEDIVRLQTQLANQTTNSTTVADQLTALFFQLKVFNVSASAETVIPIQLNVDSATQLTTSSRSEQVAFLDDLLVSVNDRKDAIADALAALEPEILALQGERQQLQAEVNQLNRNLTVAEETYTTLARKVDEERISAEGQANNLRLASNAAVPNNPTNSTLTAVILAAIVGVMASTGAIFVAEWWQNTTPVTLVHISENGKEAQRIESVEKVAS
ncbi:MAG: hypothetical protein Kow0080_32260 [Candidatus Promineifilaceae bacterium]